MAEDIAKLGLKISSDDVLKAIKRLDKLEAQSKKNEHRNDKLKKSFSGLGGAIGSLGLGLALKKVIDKTVEQEKAIAQLDAAVKSTGGSAGFTSKELQKLAASLQNTSTFGDEAIISMQSVLLTFTKLQGDILPRTTQAVLDLSTRMGMDLTSSSVMLGKALNDPIANLGALSRSGIQFTETQKDMIKRLAESGKLAQAQTIILKELETQFGGSAKAARDTFGGALAGLSNAFGDLLEEDGNGLKDAKTATEELTEILKDPATKKAFSIMTGAVIDLTSALVKGVTWLTKFGDSIGKTVSDMVNGKPEIVAIKDEIAALELVQQRVVFGSDAWKNATDRLTESYKKLKEYKDEMGITSGGAITPPAAGGGEGKSEKQTQFGGAAFGTEGDRSEFGAGYGESLEDFANRLNEEREAQREHKEELLEIEMDYYDRLYNMQAGSQQASLDFANAMRDGDYKSAVKNGSLMLSNAAKTSKTMFGIQKALSLANAVATLPSAVMKSFENGGGYPWGLVPAGLMAAQGAAQIQAIRSTTFGGGSASASVRGGSTSPSAPVASGLPEGATAVPSGSELKKPSVQELRVTVEGDGPHSEGMRKFAENLAETIKDMGGVSNLVLT